jgi:Transposase DDE domain
VGPKKTKILVTNLSELTPRQVVSMYQKRWAIELVNWELKSGLGLGQHQVRGDAKRSTNSVGIAVLAYLFLPRACYHECVFHGKAATDSTRILPLIPWQSCHLPQEMGGQPNAGHNPSVC